MRIVYIIFIIGKYLFLCLLSKIGLSREQPSKFTRKFLEDAGGSFIKFGQLLALRVDVLPKEYTLELLNLFDNVPSFPASFVEEVFLQELGATPDKIFKDFQKKPFASASFGQVHAALLENNHLVAVKILRPGIERKVAADFLMIDILASVADLFFKIEALPWKEFASEFKKWTREELDYRIEAERTQLMYQNALENENIVIPKVYPHLSTKRILVEDYVEGIPLNRVLMGLRDGRLNREKLLKLGIDIKKTSKTLAFELLREFFLNDIFHADPHPGNILLLKDDKIGLIDFGIVGEAITYNKKSLINYFKSALIDKDLKQAIYHFANFTSGDLKNIIGSALPANVSQNKVDEFMHMLASYFKETVSKITLGSKKELDTMKKDYNAVFFQIIKSAQKYKVKLPKQAVVFIRMLSVVGFLAKELDQEFQLDSEAKKFFMKYPEAALLKNAQDVYPYKRITYERAIEQVNSWLAYLVETDPQLYQIVKQELNKYTLITKV